jgi:hypothetical protein
MGAEMFLAERETDVTKLIVAFRSFVKASKGENVSGKCIFFTEIRYNKNIKITEVSK